MLASRRRGAFSLIEILVVLAILATVISLTVGAVQRTRSAYLRLERSAWLEARRQHQNLPRTQPVRVLFIGNSYTSVNDLPATLKALSGAAGPPGLVVDSHLVGGAKLKDHWDAGTAPDKIRNGDWDFVVLQEQSQTPLPAFGRETFYVPFAKQFAELIRQHGAVPILYLTWTRPDTPGFSQRDYTTSVTDLARNLKAEVAPAGIAKELVEQQIPGFGFYADAGGHPTPTGTYLVACAFFATIFDKSPEGLPASVATPSGAIGVPPAQAPIVQKAAADALATLKRILDRDPEKRNLR